MSYQIKWLSDNYSDADVGDIFTVDNNGEFFDKAGDVRCIDHFEKGVDYEVVDNSDKEVVLMTYNGKLYDKKAFEEAIQGLVVYSVE